MSVKWRILHIPSGELVTIWVRRSTEEGRKFKTESEEVSKSHLEFSCLGLISDDDLGDSFRRLEYLKTKKLTVSVLDRLISYLTTDLQHVISSYYLLKPDQKISGNEFEIVKGII